MTSVSRKLYLALSLIAALLAGLLLVTTSAEADSGTQEARKLRIVSANLNWGLSQKEVAKDVSAYADKADVILFQETRNVNVHKLFGKKWKVVQKRDGTTAKRNVGIAVRNSAVKKAEKPYYKLGVRSNGSKFYTRWILGMKLHLPNDETLQVNTIHMPVKKWDGQRKTMATRIVKHAEGAASPVVIGGDWNAHIKSDPFNIGKRTGLKHHGVGIDGFFVEQPAIKFHSVKALPKGNSDHRPIKTVLSMG